MFGVVVEIVSINWDDVGLSLLLQEEEEIEVLWIILWVEVGCLVIRISDYLYIYCLLLDY